MRQCPDHYAIRAGQNLPDKEFRYLRTDVYKRQAQGYEAAKGQTLAALALMDEARRQAGLHFAADEA